MSIHIEAKKDEIAPTVLMPGDPLRAKYIADNFLSDVILINDVRNMLGYTGYYKGKKVTIMGSGMGIPSIGIYSYELYNDYDVQKIIRIGSGGSLSKDVKLKDIVLAKNSYSPSSFAYVWGKCVDNVINSSEKINNQILDTAKKLKMNINYGTIMTADVFTVYADVNHIFEKMPKHIKLLANEMEAFGLFHVANLCGKEATCLMTIVDSPFEENMLSQEEKEKNLNDMILLALESI
ncbi:MAG: purine-nucleoside phosphorylase [Bacilli bacterium]|nr:purine-nucleoside phosphorylase [Bacilli bacterium]